MAGWVIEQEGNLVASPQAPFETTDAYQITVAHLDASRSFVMLTWAHNYYSDWGPNYCMVFDHSDPEAIVWGDWALMPSPIYGYSGWWDRLTIVNSNRILASAADASHAEQWCIVDISYVTCAFSSILPTPTLPTLSGLMGTPQVYVLSSQEGLSGMRLDDVRVVVYALGYDDSDPTYNTRRHWLVALNTDDWVFEDSSVALPLNPEYPLYPTLPQPLIYVPEQGCAAGWETFAWYPMSGIRIVGWDGTDIVLGPPWYTSLQDDYGDGFIYHDSPVPFQDAAGAWKAMGSKGFYELSIEDREITETAAVPFTDARSGVGEYNHKVVVPDALDLGYAANDGTLRLSTDQGNSRAGLASTRFSKSAGDGSENILSIVPRDTGIWGGESTEEIVTSTAPWSWVRTPVDDNDPYPIYRQSAYDGPMIYWYAYLRETATGLISFHAESASPSSNGSAGFSRPSDFDDLVLVEIPVGSTLYAVVISNTFAGDAPAWNTIDVNDPAWKLVWVAATTPVQPSDVRRFYLAWSHERPVAYFADYLLSGSHAVPYTQQVWTRPRNDSPNRGTRTIDFGDGASKIDSPPVTAHNYHTWTTAGIVTVTMDVVDDLGHTADYETTFTLTGTIPTPPSLGGALRKRQHGSGLRRRQRAANT